MAQISWCRLYNIRSKCRLFGIRKHILKRYCSNKIRIYDLLHDESMVSKNTTESVKNDDAHAVSTPPKDVSDPLPNAYLSEAVESHWYEWWNSNGHFSPDYKGPRHAARSDEGSKTFVMCLPPPNITGTLHLGHALGDSIQDAIVRWHRMSGDESLWLPGTDHAGIATQVVVEKELYRDLGISRHQLGRQEFIQKVWKWKMEKGGMISEQMKRLGLSLDWTRETFTLDPKQSYAVREAFIRLHDEGLIHRTKRPVNWCCNLRSAISDIEVETMEIPGETLLSIPGYDKQITFGQLTNLIYKVEDHGRHDPTVTIGTTRPETILGDVAIAVHPQDERYTYLHGKHVLHPLTGERLPVIVDEFVNMEFASGVVKITPGHDLKDYEVAIRHSLPIVNILAEDGTLTNVPEPFQNVRRYTAREMVVQMMKKLNLLGEVTSHKMTLPICSRTGDVIEMVLRDQWFVDCKQMAREAMLAVSSGNLELIPGNLEKKWYDWLQNARSRDWCISRQLWWGHQIPAYRVTDIDTGADLGWFSAHNKEEAIEKVCQNLNMSAEEIKLTQETDVLDTWFSSALIPFSAFGWPNKTEDFSRFYPTTTLDTGSDIMFFWVARMVMMGLKLTGELPFKQVILHGVIRDGFGRKMSKSLGNVIDPMDVIHGITLQELYDKIRTSTLTEVEQEKVSAAQARDCPKGIPTCGADALRFTLCSFTYTADYIQVEVDKIVSHRKFINKIWQSFRFISNFLTDDFQPKPIQMDVLSPTDRWLLSRLAHLVCACDKAFTARTLFKATGALRYFWWDEMCDVYMEFAKSVLTAKDEPARENVEQVLHLVLTVYLRAMAPFMPYLCEELYHRMPALKTPRTDSIFTEPYPKPHEYHQWQDEWIEEDMTITRRIINHINKLRVDYNLFTVRTDVYIESKEAELLRALANHKRVLMRMSRSNHLVFADPPIGCVTQLDELCSIHIDTKGQVDFDLEKRRLGINLEKLDKSLEKLVPKTDRERGVPDHIAQKAEEKIENIKERIERLQKAIASIEKMQAEKAR